MNICAQEECEWGVKKAPVNLARPRGRWDDNSSTFHTEIETNLELILFKYRVLMF